MKAKVVAGSLGLGKKAEIDASGVRIGNAEYSSVDGASYRAELGGDEKKTSVMSVLLGLLILTPILTILFNVVGLVIGVVMSLLMSTYKVRQKNSHTISFTDGNEITVKSNQDISQYFNNGGA